MNNNPYIVLQDFESNWYWIPKEQKEDFEDYNNLLSGISFYIDNPNAFDKFEEKFEKFRTGGCSSIMPDYWKEYFNK